MFTYDNIIDKLNGYEDLIRKASLLQFELDNYRAKITDEDMIDTMTFNSILHERVTGGLAKDKTADIAISFRDRANQMNIRGKKDLEEEVGAIQIEIARINHYLSLLGEKERKVLNSIYIKRLTLTETAEATGIPLTTIKRIRKAAVEKLVDMYNLIITE